MSSPKNILFKGIVYTLLVSQVLLYMIVPGTNGKDSLAGGRMSFDDFFFEQVLHIPDQTPADETDDVERVVQLVRVERFQGNNDIPNPVTFHINLSPYHTDRQREPVSVVHDILVPPPL